MQLPLLLTELGKSFLKNDILSIDIGFTNIKIVHARKKADKLKVIDYAVGDTPSGCIRNGVISDLEGIAENLRKVISDRRINERNVKIVISAGSNIISKLIHIPKGEQRAVEALIREEVKRQMPVNILDQRLFYRVTGETELNSNNYLKVLVTVVPNSIIENYVKLLGLLNFRPLSIEIPFSSVARFFSRGIEMSEKEKLNRIFSDAGSCAVAVIDLGSETTNMSILNNGALEFNRIILTGGRNLDEVIASRLDIKRADAERLKKLYGISMGEAPLYETEKVVDQCARYYLGEIFENIKRSIEFYVEKCGGSEIGKMILVGGGSGMKGIREFVRSVVNMPVLTLDMINLNYIEFDVRLDREKIRFLVNALGIAM